MTRILLNRTIIPLLLFCSAVSLAMDETHVQYIGEAVGAQLKVKAMLVAVSRTHCSYVFSKKPASFDESMSEIRDKVPAELKEYINGSFLKRDQIEEEANIEVNSMIHKYSSALDANTNCGMAIGQITAMQLAANYKFRLALAGKYYELPH